MLKWSLNLQALAWWHVGLTDDTSLHDESPPPIVPCLLAEKQITSRKLGQEI